MSNLTLVGDTPSLTSENTPEEQMSQTWREKPVSPKWCFRSTDAAGRRGWFLRLSITGLYSRRVGPYSTKRQALDALEEVLAGMQTEPLCALQNAMNMDQAYVVEGVPVMKGKSEKTRTARSPR